MGKCIFQDSRISDGFRIYSAFDFNGWQASNRELPDLGARLSSVPHWPWGPCLTTGSQVDEEARGPRRSFLEHYWVLWFIIGHFIIRATLSFPQYSESFNDLFLLSTFPHHSKDQRGSEGVIWWYKAHRQCVSVTSVLLCKGLPEQCPHCRDGTMLNTPRRRLVWKQLTGNGHVAGLPRMVGGQAGWGFSGHVEGATTRVVLV